MPPFKKMALPVLGTLVWAGVLFSPLAATSQPAPPPLVAEEMRHVRSDFATGGIRRLSANWYACIDQVRGSQDANAAERCVVYGYGALLVGDTSGSAAGTPWMRHLTADIVAPGQLEMLAIMGIPEGPRQAWLDRYQRWVSERYTADIGAPDAGAADIAPPPGDAPYGGGPRGGNLYDGAPTIGAPAGNALYGGEVPRRGNSHGGTSYDGGPYGVAAYGGGRGNREGQTDLAKVADGKYPREALREPDIGEALRQLVGQPVFSHLKDYSYGSPMEFTGRYTVGAACEPGACGVSEARYVFSPGDVWIGIVDGRRMRIYGNPPKPVRALLLRDRNQTVWRGPVDDMTHPVVPPVIQASVGSTTAGPPPRMSISPHPLPIAAEPVSRGQPDSGATEIRLQNRDGTLVVPVLINNTLTIPFTIDSGASDVSVSAGVMDKLMQSGTVSKADFLGKQVYHLADGSTVSSETFRIHVLKVGDREVRDVMGSVTNDADSLLLGQSFLRRFRSWSIDNQRQVLLLK